MQDDALVRLYVPAGHALQLMAPPRLNVPASQSEHDAPPTFRFTDPASSAPSSLSSPVDYSHVDYSRSRV